MATIIEQAQYKAERSKILRDMKDFHKAKGNDYKKIVTAFVNDLTVALISIQNDPCRYPDFPAPVKKKIFSKGTTQCVILYLPAPSNHMNNSSLVDKVYLTSIMITSSGAYNLYVMKQLPDSDLDV
jgi:hypothetical protein